MKVIAREEIGVVVRRLREEGRRVVLTNGCFDILHAGHVRYLSEARKLGDVLIVALNSDASLRRLKGPERPINPEVDRAEVLAGLWAVDYVVIFSENTAEEIVRETQPHVYVKGGDYEVKELPESKIVAEYGGETVLIPEVPGRSSSRIIERMRQKTE